LRLKSAVKIAAIKAVYTQLGIKTSSSISAAAGIKAVYTQLGIKTSSSISATAGSFQATRLKFNVTTLNRILADAKEGNFVYFAKYFDTFYIQDGARPSDQMVFEVAKALTDDAAFAEAYVAAFNKVVNDGVNIADAEEFIKNFQKPVSDDLAVSELHSLSVEKPASDAFSVGDDGAKLHPNKVKLEIVGTSDDIDTVDFGKFEQDGVPLTDLYRVTYAKPAVADAYSVSDADSWNLEKPLFDDVLSPDDYVVLFTKKAPDDTLVISEQLIKDLERSLSDAFGVAEARSLDLDKVLFDQVAGVGDYVFLFTKKAPDSPVSVGDLGTQLALGKNVSDASAVADEIDNIDVQKSQDDTAAATDDINTVGTTKQLTDDVYFTDDVDGEASILDDQEMQFMKNRTDVVGFSDFFASYTNYYRDFTDTGTAVDSLRFSGAKSLADSPLATETINMLTGKQIYDIPVISESLKMAVTKAPFLDSALLGDATTVAAGKVLLDSASTTDAGSLRSQGYSDFTFFAEDFVGASTTF